MKTMKEMAETQPINESALYDDIIQKLSHVPSDKDFSQFQSLIRTMIDDMGGNSLDIFPEHYQTRVIGYKK